MNWIEKDKKYVLPVYAKYPLTIVKGKGSYVWDEDGKKYLDFYGGHAVCILGHCLDAVASAIKEQVDELIFYSNVFYTKPAIELAEILATTMPPSQYKVFFANSGSEANETAIKIARKYSGKSRIVSFEGSFHGRSITNLGVTGIESYQKYKPDLIKYSSFAKFGDMESVRACCDEDTAAVILEPIQSIGGMNMAEESFYLELAAFCKRSNIILIVDEVQAGLGRSGKFWFSQKLGIEPDMITSAKGIASGLPLSAVLVKDVIASKVEISDHSTTFGGGPVPCAAGVAVMKTILEDGFLESVEKKSQMIKNGLTTNSLVKNILGTGLLLGIELAELKDNLIEKCLDRGLIIGASSKKNVFRITPPLNITEEEVKEFLSIFNDLVK